MSNIRKSIAVVNRVFNVILGDNFTRPIEQEMAKRPDNVYLY
jgi:hypothetical protein